jgi:ubiquinone/menaquinone biosynthesis C-methylase UbiE
MRVLLVPAEGGPANIDLDVVRGFGDEWKRFDQSGLTASDHQEIFDDYFSIFPWESLPKDAVGLDVGCGSGRWAKLVAPRVGRLHCIDASEQVLSVARNSLAELPNCEFHHASVDAIPVDPESADFAYSLGVLHHVPDTQAGLSSVVSRLKRGAPFLVYLYYAFDNKPVWYRWLWKVSESGRFVVARSPLRIRYVASQVLATTVYYPLAHLARLAEVAGFNVDSFPLAYYRDRSFYVMRTDALDRFGTRLEKRFTRGEIEAMLIAAKLERITFSEHAPYWCAVGYKK